MIDISKFFDSVDTVCLNCGYLSEETCESCPVRKTCDDIYNSSDYKDYLREMEN